MKKIKIIALYEKPYGNANKILRRIKFAFPHINLINFCTTNKNLKKTIYIDTQTFIDKVINGDLVEAGSQGDSFIGTDIINLKKDKINIGIFSVDRINCLITDDRLDILPIEIITSNFICLKHMLKKYKNNKSCIDICKKFLENQKNEEEDFNSIRYVIKRNHFRELKNYINAFDQK